MPQIQTLVHALLGYQALPHHSNPNLKQTLDEVQHWQKQRIRRTNHALFHDEKTAPFANYLINRIYGDDDFCVLARQLLTAGTNALNGSGKLEKLIPANALGAGISGVQLTITAIELDLALTKSLLTDFHYYPNNINHKSLDELMPAAYRKVNAKEARIAQLSAIKDVCEQSHKYFGSFILQNTFKLAKNMAYNNGYQPLYDFIKDGLIAMKPLKNIGDFVTPFIQNELLVIEEIHQ